MAARFLGCIIGLLLAATGAWAQLGQRPMQVGRYYQITLLDGTRMEGRVDSVTARKVYLTHPRSGAQSVLVSVIESYQGEVRTPSGYALSPHASKSWIAPSAIPLKKGERLYQNLMIEFNTLEYAVTDAFSVGATAGLFSSALGSPNVVPTLKYAQTYRPNRHVAVGVGGVLSWYGWFFNSGHWVPYVAHTWGNSEAQWTAGAFWMYETKVWGVSVNDWAAQPGAYFSGSKRLSGRWMVGGEYAVTGLHAVDSWSGGSEVLFDGMSHYGTVYGRYLWPRASLDFGVVGTVNTWGWFSALPLVGYSRRF